MRIMMRYPFHEICSIMMQEPQCRSTAEPYSTTAENYCEKNRAQPCYTFASVCIKLCACYLINPKKRAPLFSSELATNVVVAIV